MRQHQQQVRLLLTGYALASPAAEISQIAAGEARADTLQTYWKLRATSAHCLICPLTVSASLEGRRRMQRATPLDINGSITRGSLARPDAVCSSGPGPSSAARRLTSASRSGNGTLLRPGRGSQPSQYSTKPRSANGPSPPMIIGGCGFWTGFGQLHSGSKLT